MRVLPTVPTRKCYSALTWHGWKAHEKHMHTPAAETETDHSDERAVRDDCSCVTALFSKLRCPELQEPNSCRHLHPTLAHVFFQLPFELFGAGSTRGFQWAVQGSQRVEACPRVAKRDDPH